MDADTALRFKFWIRHIASHERSRVCTSVCSPENGQDCSRVGGSVCKDINHVGECLLYRKDKVTSSASKMIC